MIAINPTYMNIASFRLPVIIKSGNIRNINAIIKIGDANQKVIKPNKRDFLLI